MGLVMAILTSDLADGGFTASGKWVLDDQNQFGVRLDGTPPRPAGVYAHVVDGVACYVGAAQKGLHRRLKHYQTTTQEKRTAFRVRSMIRDVLQNGSVVETYVLVPPQAALIWQGLPVDLVQGIEEGLIRKFRPAWNFRGSGRSRTTSTLIAEV